MKEKPILFNSEMVKAVLEGRKTQTRRVIKNACDIIQDWDDKDKSYGPYYEDQYGDFHKSIEACPYGQIGNKLWVRETFTYHRNFGEDVKPDAPIIYKADKDNCGQYPCEINNETILVSQKMPWKPSIFMPKSACRIWLEITDIRVERVRDIGESESIKEGVSKYKTAGLRGWMYYNEDNLPLRTYELLRDTRVCGCARSSFLSLWDSINEKRGYPWESNPWVWVVEFKRIDK